MFRPESGKDAEPTGFPSGVPPEARLLAAVGLVCGVVAMPGLWVPGLSAVAALLAVLTFVLPVDVGAVLKRLLLVEPFAAAIAAMALFQPGGWGLFASMIVKSTLCLYVMVLLGAVTSFSEILKALAVLRVPTLLISTMALAYRYLFVLVEEGERMKRARLSRSFKRNRLHAWRMLSSIISELFIRATGRAERIYAAMCARGWKG